MSLEIITVKDAQGVAIEKKIVSSITVDANSGLINIGHENAIKRADDQWIISPNYGQSLSLLDTDFTGADLTAFNKALTDFKAAIVSLSTIKLGV